MTWPSHDLTPQQTSRHQNTSLQSTKHHHHGTAEGSFTAKKWFGHRAGRSPCAHSIGKFFLCYIVLFLLETSAPGLSGYYWYRIYVNVKKWDTFPPLSGQSMKLNFWSINENQQKSTTSGCGGWWEPTPLECVCTKISDHINSTLGSMGLVYFPTFANKSSKYRGYLPYILW